MRWPKVKFYGWPWQLVNADDWATLLDKTKGQKYGWNPFSVKGWGRFGGGWAFKLGVTIGSSMRDWIFEFGIGAVRITFPAKKQIVGLHEIETQTTGFKFK